jgi:hypothetical protein
MTKPTEHTPATVPLAQQAGATDADRAIRSRWRWVEPCAWTVRMLTALEQGVKGTKWFRLIDKVFAERNLFAAFQQVAKKRGAAGVDHVTTQGFERQLPDAIWELSDALKAGTYAPQAIRRVHIPKPGTNESPLLSNIYLDPLDHLLAESGFEMVRYADDFVILCRTAEDAARALELVQQWVADNGLTLHPTKTKVIDSRTEGFDFLGFTFRGEKHWPRDKSRRKLKDALRAKTQRTSGDSLQCIVKNVNRTLRGWYVYFQHSSFRNVFTDIDGWTRMRLRSILRKRAGRRGRGRGLDHHRWPNRYFAEHGLFSLATAHALVVQSSKR